MADLHSPRQLVSSIIAAIPPESPPGEQAANPIKDVSVTTKNLFLTLYVLFEKEFGPALDLLDRRLVTRLKHKREDRESSDNKSNPATLLLVRSAQQQNARNSAYEHVNYYEVRLDAWSCSCPAFTFSAFPATSSSEVEDDTGGRHLFGGLTRGSAMPVCKHLIACILVEHCQMFAHLVEEREVSMEELAGWAAGWGD